MSPSLSRFGPARRDIVADVQATSTSFKRQTIYCSKTAVIDALVDTYSDLDHFREALAAARAQHDDDRPRHEAELAATTAQIRDTTAALDRYLRAFETASMPQQMRRPLRRARRPTQRAERAPRPAHRRAQPPHPPGRDHLEHVAVTLRDVIDEGSPHLVKDLLAGLIARIEIHPERRAQPIFKACQVPVPA